MLQHRNNIYNNIILRLRSVLLTHFTNTELVEVSLFYREAKTMSVAVEMLCLSRITIRKVTVTIREISNV